MFYIHMCTHHTNMVPSVRARITLICTHPYVNVSRCYGRISTCTHHTNMVASVPAHCCPPVSHLPRGVFYIFIYFRTFFICCITSFFVFFCSCCVHFSYKIDTIMDGGRLRRCPFIRYLFYISNMHIKLRKNTKNLYKNI